MPNCPKCSNSGLINASGLEDMVATWHSILSGKIYGAFTKPHSGYYVLKCPKCDRKFAVCPNCKKLTMSAILQSMTTIRCSHCRTEFFVSN